MRSLFVLALLAAASPVAAQETAADWLAEADRLEGEGRPREARDAWQHVVDLGPGARIARRAERRIEWLEARSEGDYAPLAAWLHFQALDDDARTDAALEAFAGVVASMPPGRVRVESRLALATAYGARGEADRAREAYRTLDGDPFLAPGEPSLIAEDLARLEAGVGNVEEALEALDHGGRHDSSSYTFLARQARRRILEPLAWVTCALFALVTLLGILRAPSRERILRHVLRPTQLAVLVPLALAPLALVHVLADEAAGAFDLLAVVSVVTLVAASALGEALESLPPRTRAVSAMLGAAATLAGAYLAVAYYGDALPFG